MSLSNEVYIVDTLISENGHLRRLPCHLTTDIIFLLNPVTEFILDCRDLLISSQESPSCELLDAFGIFEKFYQEAKLWSKTC